MTQTSATQRAADNTEIRPFHVNFPEEELVELRRRINAARLPEKETAFAAARQRAAPRRARGRRRGWA